MPQRPLRLGFPYLGLVGLCCAWGCTHAPAPPATVTTMVQQPDVALASAEPPIGRLPNDVRPLRYALGLSVVPGQERFFGQTRIEVELRKPTDLIWLHGKGLNVTSARSLSAAGAVAARYTQHNEHGLSRLDFAEVLPAGAATLELTYDAPFDSQLTGLYKVTSEGQSYAFTQFEATSARQAFPCFDEPAFKTPFDIELTIQADHSAVSNTPELATQALPTGQKRVRFATTKKLPTYLLAFIVGPLDIVEAAPIAPNAVRTTPLALRGVAVRGRGSRLAYALKHTGPLLAELERYLGIAYPYEKLDVIAVPDFSAGAMENAGAITFREWLLMLDEQAAPEGQRRSFANVMAHELAHHWFGNLVTMPWWDDIWLNESFATWLASRTVAAVHPEQRAMSALLSSVIGVMDNDSRVSARKVRQPIESTHDIANAFDGITYQKGAGVLSMFERYLGADTFQKGLHAFLLEHAYGNATGKDLFSALSSAAAKDVAPAISSFVDQVGVPLLSVEVTCAQDKQSAALELAQSRYLPIGSSGSRSERWQLPLCVRYEIAGKSREHCTLLSETTGRLVLQGGCPLWVMPNAEGAGYYRFTMAAPDWAALSAGFAKLSLREKQSFVDSLQAGFASGALSAKDVLAALPALAADADRPIATAPMAVLSLVREHMLDVASRPALDRFANRLYAKRVRALGWQERASDDGETKLLRAELLTFFAVTLRDPGTRKTAGQLGRRYLGLGKGQKPQPSVVPPDLRRLVITVAIQEGDQETFDAVLTRLRDIQDPDERGHLLHGLVSVTDARSKQALALSLDPMLRVNEVHLPLRAQTAETETRDAAWAFLEQNIDKLLDRVSKRAGSRMIFLAVPFCSEAMAERANAFFSPRIEQLDGGPRSLASTLESLHLCAAQVSAQQASARAFFQ